MNTICMRAIIKETFLKAVKHLEAWRATVRQAQWKNLADVWQAYPDMDAIKVRSGRQVLIFNIRRNDYRLIAAAHFNCQIVYTMRFMTHAEYSKGRWKDTL